ncbi:MAG: hypothetical protein ACI9K3_001530, partial [Halovenus sp.]
EGFESTIDGDEPSGNIRLQRTTGD